MRAVEVLSQQAVKGWLLKDALLATDCAGRRWRAGLAAATEITALGLEVLGVSVMAIRPTPETAKALAAEAREAILKAADDAIYARRNAAVEAEREIRESELETRDRGGEEAAHGARDADGCGGGDRPSAAGAAAGAHGGGHRAREVARRSSSRPMPPTRGCWPRPRRTGWAR